MCINAINWRVSVLEKIYSCNDVDPRRLVEETCIDETGSYGLNWNQVNFIEFHRL
jgi:hypothetical protein